MLNRTARALLDLRPVTDHYVDVLGCRFMPAGPVLNRTARALLDRRPVTNHDVDCLGKVLNWIARALLDRWPATSHYVDVLRVRVQASGTGVEPDRACLTGA